VLPEQLDIRIAGEDAVIAYCGTPSPATVERLRNACLSLRASLADAIVDLVPSYASLLVLFDPLKTDAFAVQQALRDAFIAAATPAATVSGRSVELPVYYAPEAGPDLEDLARRAGLSISEVIALHSGREYQVYAIGFAPGFAYLGEVDERIAAPRLATPRLRVPRGAVAVADRQTAIYPSVSPGGWNLIGLSPVRMFDPAIQPAMPVAVGDTVSFRSISRGEFLAMGGALP